MHINNDFSNRVVININSLPWIDSPLAGVQRRMLERDGDETARATSLVRYAPDSYFDRHTHDGGEEFLVLEGTFSDDMGDFPAGMYVRNPIDSNHKPYSKEGCLIFVKLRQFDENDKQYIRVNTNNADWEKLDDISILNLHEFNNEHIKLIKLDKGASLRKRNNLAGEEIFVLKGEFNDEHGSYPAGTWLRNPVGFGYTPYSHEGCTLYIKSGHLLNLT